MNIEYLVIRYRKPYNLKSLYIKSKQREEDDISYTMCLRRIFDLADIKTKNDITRAFRDTIYYTAMGRFRRQFPDKKCALCESTENICVDHYGKSFQDIMDTFLRNRQIQKEDIQVHEYKNMFEFELPKDDSKKKGPSKKGPAKKKK